MPPLLSPAEKGVDIVGRAAPEAAVQGVFLLVHLGQHRLHVGRGGTDQGGDPHPEHGARAAHGNGGHHAHHVAHAHPGSGGNDQRLDAGKGAAFAGTLMLGCDAQHFPEAPHRQEPGAHRKIDARRDQDGHQQGDADAAAQGNHKQIAPKKIVNC